MRHSSGLPLSPKLRDYLGLDLPPPPEPHALTGCQRLCLAVLADALHVLYTTRHVHLDATTPAKVGTLRKQALAWFTSADDGPFSLDWICSMLPTLNAKAIRDTLHAANWQGSRHTHHTQFFAHGSGKRALLPSD
jgi:hypothetical protein